MSSAIFSLLGKFLPLAIKLCWDPPPRRKAMKRSAKQLKPQMNLPLLNMPATTVPNHKQKELELTLMEFLINAAIENKDVARANGERDEPL
jgi:hypothetical protein